MSIRWLLLALMVLLAAAQGRLEAEEPATTYSLFAETPFAAPNDNVTPALDYDELIHRLEKAERRIQDLEAERSDNGSIAPIAASAVQGERNDAKDSETSVRLTKLEDLFKKLDDGQKAFVLPGHSGATMKVVGRIHLDYWGFPETDPGINAFETLDPTISPQNNFQFRRLRFGVRGDVKPNMEYRIEMEYAGGNDVEFRDAFLAFKYLPIVQTLVIGNQKRPYGLDHWNSSRYNVFLERPFVVEAINQDSRRLGIQSWAYSEDLRYNWQYGVFTQRLIQDEGDYYSDHLQGEIAGRFASTIWYDDTSNGRGYAHVAVSGSVAHPDGSAGSGPLVPGLDEAQNEARFRTRPEARSASRWIDTGRIRGADWYELANVEGVLNIGATQIVAEWMNLFLQRDDGTLPNDDNLYFNGGYVYVAHFLTGEHMPWDRETGQLDRPEPFENFFLVRNEDGSLGRGWGAWQIAARYSTADFTNEDIAGGVGESLTLGLNWYWNSYARMQFNYIVGRIDERAPAAGYTSGDYHIVGTRVMVDF